MRPCKLASVVCLMGISWNGEQSRGWWCAALLCSSAIAVATDLAIMHVARWREEDIEQRHVENARYLWLR